MQVDVKRSLGVFPAVGLVGPRQVGKTTLARAIEANWSGKVLHLDLESPDDLAKLGNAELFLQQHADHLVVIDEAQQKPERFPVLRVLIDRPEADQRKPIGGWLDKDRTNGSWRVEPAGCIAWALRLVDALPDYDRQFRPFAIMDVIPQTNRDRVGRGGLPVQAEQTSTSTAALSTSTRSHRQPPATPAVLRVFRLFRAFPPNRTSGPTDPPSADRTNPDTCARDRVRAAAGPIRRRKSFICVAPGRRRFPRVQETAAKGSRTP